MSATSYTHTLWHICQSSYSLSLYNITQTHNLLLTHLKLNNMDDKYKRVNALLEQCTCNQDDWDQDEDCEWCYMAEYELHWG